MGQGLKRAFAATAATTIRDEDRDVLSALPRNGEGSVGAKAIALCLGRTTEAVNTSLRRLKKGDMAERVNASRISWQSTEIGDMVLDRTPRHGPRRG